MQQGQLLLSVIALFPFISWLALRFFKNFEGLYNFSYYLFPILFLINLFQASQYFKLELNQLIILEAVRGLSMSIYVDKLSLVFLYVLGFIWLLFSFYSTRYFQILSNKNSYFIKGYFLLIVSFLNFLILSENLFTILFFYICLIISTHFFGVRYLNFIETKFTKFFTFILYLESFLIFIATVITYKINGQIDFSEKIILPSNYDQLQHLIIFLLFFFGLFLAMSVPIYLFFKNIKFDSLILMVLFMVSYGFSSCFVFLKILNYIYGFKGLALITKIYGLRFFEVIVLINLVISAIFFLKNNDLKSSSFFIFVNQFIFLIFSILIHASGKFNFAVISLIGFLINFTILFFCLGNFELYLHKSPNKSLSGIFYIMPITTVISFFGFLSLIGLAPSFSMVDKFTILSFLIKNKMYFSMIILVLNIIFLGIFTFKRYQEFFRKEVVIKSSGQIENIAIDEKILNLGKKIDLDSSLILTTLFVTICGFVGLIFFSYITQFLSFYEAIKG